MDERDDTCFYNLISALVMCACVVRFLEVLLHMPGGPGTVLNSVQDGRCVIS